MTVVDAGRHLLWIICAPVVASHVDPGVRARIVVQGPDRTPFIRRKDMVVAEHKSGERVIEIARYSPCLEHRISDLDVGHSVIVLYSEAGVGLVDGFDIMDEYVATSPDEKGYCNRCSTTGIGKPWCFHKTPEQFPLPSCLFGSSKSHFVVPHKTRSRRPGNCNSQPGARPLSRLKFRGGWWFECHTQKYDYSWSFLRLFQRSNWKSQLGLSRPVRQNPCHTRSHAQAYSRW